MIARDPSAPVVRPRVSQLLPWLTHNTALTNGDSEGCGHGQGSASFLTGAQALKTQDAVRVDISADQLYARHVGNQTRFPTLELGANRLDRGTRSVTAGPTRRTSPGAPRPLPPLTR